MTAVPKRHVLEQLALLAENEEERAKLLELASPEGADLYHEVCRCGGVRCDGRRRTTTESACLPVRLEWGKK